MTSKINEINDIRKSDKNYPPVIVVRKYLIVVAGIFLILIAALIFYNVAHSSHVNKKSSTSVNGAAGTLVTATQTDMNYYQNQTIQKSPTIQTSTSVTTDTHNPVGSAPFNRPTSSQNTSENDASTQAPSKINQLTASLDGNTNSSASLGNSLNASVGMNSTNSDDSGSQKSQAMQNEKKGFIQAEQQSSNDYLQATLNNPLSRYEIKAGTIIPGVLITGINSDLPGQITAQVISNVYDTISGRYVLIPQGAKLTGSYDSQIAYGQQRVLVVWQRIIFPNGQSIDLQGMPGVDLSGYSGLHDQVNNHYTKLFGSVILMSALSAGAQLSQPQQANSVFAAPTVGQTLAQSLGTAISNTGTLLTQKNLNIQPTLIIRPGYEFNISVTKDMVFPNAYSEGTQINGIEG
jgi:type IV secretory pathway VirB10-like protein